VVLCLIAFNAERCLLARGIDLAKLLAVQVLTQVAEAQACALCSFSLV